MEELETLSRWLLEKGEEEPSVVASIEGQRSILAKQLGEQQQKIDQRYLELQNILMHGQEFEVNCDNLEKKLVNLESEVHSLRPVSAIYETLKIQKIDSERIKEDLKQCEPVYMKVIEEGEELVEETSPGEEKDVLFEKLSNLKTRWSEVKAKIEDFEKNLEKTSPLAKKYETVKWSFAGWISATEAKMDLIEPKTLKRDTIRDFLLELESIQDNVNVHGRDYDEVQRAGIDLIETAEEDKKVVDTELGNVEKRWVELRKRLELSKKMLEERGKTIENYEERVNVIEEVFASCEPVLVENKPYGLSDNVRKRDVQKIDELLALFEERKPVADELPNVYEELAKDIDENDPNVVVMKEKVNEIYMNFREVPQKLVSKKSTLEKEVEYVSSFNETIRKLDSSVAKVVEEFGKQPPVSTKPEEIKEQIRAIEVIEKKVEQCRDEVQDLEDCGKWLVENLPSDPRVIQEIHERIQKSREPVNSIAAKVNQRQNQLQTAALHAQEFSEYFEEFNLKIAGVEDELGSLLPVSGVYTTCCDQMSEIQELERVLSQQEPIVEKVQVVGRKVIENLDEGPEKKDTEEKLSDLEKRWENLNNKLALKKSTVSKVLEISKEFDRDSGSFREWLTRMESSVEDFSLESFDMENIEQKQKVFKGIVEEIRSKKQVQEGLEKTSGNLTNVCETDEEIIESETSSLRKRWEALAATSKSKQDCLAEMKQLVSEYNNTSKSIDDILDEADLTIKSNRCIGIGRTSVLKYLEDVEGLLERIADAEEDVEKIKSFSDEMLAQVDKNSPSAQLLEGKVKTTTEKYYQKKNELVEHFIRIQNDVLVIVKFWMIYETVEDGLPLLIEEVEALAPVSAKPSVVVRQLDETERLLEDAERYKEKVEAVEEFSEDVLSINKNEPNVVKVIQEKLTEVRIPVQKVSYVLEERLKKLQAAALKGKDYENLKEQLHDKLSSLEMAITAEQPVSGVYEKTKTQKDGSDRFSNALKQQEPVYEKVIEIGQSLLESSPEGNERAELQEEVDQLTSKWENASEKATKRGDSLQVALPLTKSYCITRDDFVTWLSEAEKKFENIDEMPMDIDTIEKIQKQLTELSEDVQAHEGMFSDYVAITKKVKEVCEDVVVVETEAKDVEGRWESLKKRLESKKLDSERVKELLTQHYKALEEINSVNEEVKRLVKSKDLYHLESEEMKATLAEVKVLISRLHTNDCRSLQVVLCQKNARTKY